MSMADIAELPFYVGDGSDVVRLTVRLPLAMGDFPRGLEWTCAYCEGDPCAERSGPFAPITLYYHRNPRAVTCPMCAGRPT